MANAFVRFKGALDDKVSNLASFPWDGSATAESSFSSGTSTLTNSWSHAERVAWRSVEATIKAKNWRAVTLAPTGGGSARAITHLHVAFVVDQLVCPECMKWMHTTMIEFAAHVHAQWGLSLVARAYKVTSVGSGGRQSCPGDHHEYVADVMQNGWVTGVGQYSTVVGLVDSGTAPAPSGAKRAEERKAPAKSA